MDDTSPGIDLNDLDDESINGPDMLDDFDVLEALDDSLTQQPEEREVSIDDEPILIDDDVELIELDGIDEPVEVLDLRTDEERAKAEASIQDLLGDIPDEYPGIAPTHSSAPAPAARPSEQEIPPAPVQVENPSKSSPLDNQSVQIAIAVGAAAIIFIGMEIFDSPPTQSGADNFQAIETTSAGGFPTPEFARAQKTANISGEDVAALIARQAKKQELESEPVQEAAPELEATHAAIPAARTSAKPRRRAARPKPAVDEPNRRRPRMGQFFAAGETIGEDKKSSGARASSLRGSPKLSLPITTRIPVKLEIGISSTRHGTVLVKTTKRLRVGKVTIPKGTVIRGQSSNDDGRVYLTFGELSLSGKQYKITGEAVQGKKRGVQAAVKETSFSQRGSAAAQSGALDAVKDITGAAVEGVASPLRRVTDRVANEATTGSGPRYRRTLEVIAGKKFQIVVTG